MGHDDEVTLSLVNRAWKSGFDVLMLTTDTWQLGWRPTDINIANYVYAYLHSVCAYSVPLMFLVTMKILLWRYGW